MGSGADLERSRLLRSLGLDEGTPLDGARLSQLMSEHSEGLLDQTPEAIGPLLEVLSGKLDSSELGIPDGIATLDSNGRLNESVDASKIDTGTLDDSHIPEGVTRDSELDFLVSAALGSDESLTFGVAKDRFIVEGADRLDAAKNGLVLDGVANDRLAFIAAVENAASKKRPLKWHGSVRLPTLTQLQSTVRLKGRPDAKINVESTGVGILIEPPKVVAGVVQAQVAGNSTVTVAGAGWAVNEHAGKWAEVFDSAINPTSNSTTLHSRRVLSNTATTLTLEHPIGYDIPAGCELRLIVPIEEVNLSDFTIDRTVVGGANLIINYARNVVMRNVTINNAGNYATGNGNAVTVRHADRVRLIDPIVNRGGNFGILVYNSTNVRVVHPIVNFWGGQFSVQLKDCIDGKVYGARSLGEGTKGDHAVNLKCSGLNPGRALAAIDCYSEKAKLAGFEFSSIVAEGTFFVARDFRFVRCISAFSSGNGFTTTVGTGLKPQGFVWEKCTAHHSGTVGFNGSTERLRILDCDAYMNQFEGIVAGAPDVIVQGGVLTDNSQSYSGSGTTRSSEIFVTDAALRAFIETVTFRRTVAGKTVRAVRNTSGGSGTLVKDCKIIEEVAAYSHDYTLPGAGSAAIGRHSVDFFTGSPTIIKQQYALV